MRVVRKSIEYELDLKKESLNEEMNKEMEDGFRVVRHDLVAGNLITGVSFVVVDYEINII